MLVLFFLLELCELMWLYCVTAVTTNFTVCSRLKLQNILRYIVKYLIWAMFNHADTNDLTVESYSLFSFLSKSLHCI